MKDSDLTDMEGMATVAENRDCHRRPPAIKAAVGGIDNVCVEAYSVGDGSECARL
jgi:hypothetical protein